MKQTRMRILPDGGASLVTVSAALVRTRVIVALSDDAFVPFRTAQNSQKVFDTITCVGVTTGTTLPIRHKHLVNGAATKVQSNGRITSQAQKERTPGSAKDVVRFIHQTGRGAPHHVWVGRMVVARGAQT